jgi:O-antigen/teichoic acid export membrane protein
MLKTRWRIPKRGSEVGRSAAAVLATSVIAQMATACSYVFAARWAGVVEFGRMAAIIGLITAGVGLLDFGTSTYSTRELAARRMSAEEAVNRLGGKCVLALVVGISGTAILTILEWVSAIESILIPLTSVAMTASLGLQGIMRGLGRPVLASSIPALERGVALGLLVALALVEIPRPATGFLIAICSGCAIVSFGFILRLTRIAGGALRLAMPYRGVAGFGVAASATSLQSLDVTLIAAASSAAAAGQYSAVSRWVAPLNLVTGALVQASFPVMSAERTTRSALRRIRPALWLIGLAWLGAGLTALLSPWLVTTILGSQYAHSAGVLSLLALATMPAAFSQITMTFLQARRRERAASMRVVFCVSVQLVLVGPASSHGGAMGAAAAILGTQVLLAVVLAAELTALFRRESEESHARERERPATKIDPDHCNGPTSNPSTDCACRPHSERRRI